MAPLNAAIVDTHCSALALTGTKHCYSITEKSPLFILGFLLTQLCMLHLTEKCSWQITA